MELDVVEGAGGKSEKVLLTMLFRNCSLMLIFLMDADRQDNVEDVFQRIYIHLGADLYRKLFPVILTDNGASFKKPDIFERPEGELLSSCLLLRSHGFLAEGTPGKESRIHPLYHPKRYDVRRFEPGAGNSHHQSYQ